MFNFLGNSFFLNSQRFSFISMVLEVSIEGSGVTLGKDGVILCFAIDNNGNRSETFRLHED